MALKRSLAWLGLSQVLTLTLQFGSSVVLARLLTPYQTGIYAVGASTAGVLAIIQSFGLQSLIVREENLTRDISVTAFTVNAVIDFGLAVAILVMSLFGRSFLHDEGVSRVLRVLAVTALIGIFNFLPSAHLERQGDFKALAIVATISTLVATVLTIVLAFCGFTYMSIAYAGLGSAIVNAVLLNVVGRRHVGFAVGLVAWRRIADFGLQMLAVSGVTSVSLRLSEILLGRIQGLAPLGVYNRAGSLNGLIWNNVHLVVGRVVFVDFAGLVRAGVPLRDRYLATVEMVTAILWPAFGGFALLSPPFILHVYGARWLPASLPLALLAIASMILVSITMTWELFTATGRLREQTRIESIRALFSLSVFCGGCLIGLSAAAASRIVDALFAVLLYRPHLNRMTDTSVRDFVPIYARSALLTLLALLPPAILMTTFGFRADVPLLLVAGAILASAVAWGTGLMLSRHPLVGEITGILGRFRQGSPARP